MKRVRINVGKVGVVSKGGDYKKVLTSGSYWIGFNDNVLAYNMGTLYEGDINLDIRLRDSQFAGMVEVIQVKENELVLMYKEGRFSSVVSEGKYFYFEGFTKFRFETLDLSKVEITENVSQNLLASSALKTYVRTFSVESFEEGILFVDGKMTKKLNQGTYRFWNNAIKVEVLKVDKRQLQMEVSGQELLTKDKAALRVNFYAQYKVEDTEKALLNSKDFEKQLYVQMQLALREFVGLKTLDEILENKEAISVMVVNSLKSKADKLGVKILYSGIRDLILPGDVKDIMNQVLVAQKSAQANTITRREETASTRSLLNTAKLMEDNTMLFKLKEMEYVERIAEKIGEITVSGNGKVVDQLKEIFSR